MKSIPNQLKDSLVHHKSLNFRFYSVLGVILFTLICFITFERALQQHYSEMHRLSFQQSELQLEKQAALKLHEALLLQLNSESDPQWLELVLMKKLGLVAEDNRKVFFKSTK